MIELALSLALFLVLHAAPVRAGLRAWLAPRVGTLPARLVASLASVAALFWLLFAAGRAPHVELWAPALWQHHLTVALMLVAFVLIGTGAATPNPFSLTFARRPFDPARPGLLAVTRHPLLFGIVLWAGAHVVPNGDLVHVGLFGIFAIGGLAGIIALDRRVAREFGPGRWRREAEATAFLDPRGLPRALATADAALVRPLLWSLAVAALVILVVHRWVFGVGPVF